MTALVTYNRDMDKTKTAASFIATANPAAVMGIIKFHARRLIRSGAAGSDRSAFIFQVVEDMAATYGGSTDAAMAAFRRRFHELRNAGDGVHFSRRDLLCGIDPAVMARSETRYRNGTFHLVTLG